MEANATDRRLGSELSLHPEFYSEANGLQRDLHNLEQQKLCPPNQTSPRKQPSTTIKRKHAFSQWSRVEKSSRFISEPDHVMPELCYADQGSY